MDWVQEQDDEQDPPRYSNRSELRWNGRHPSLTLVDISHSATINYLLAFTHYFLAAARRTLESKSVCCARNLLAMVTFLYMSKKSDRKKKQTIQITHMVAGAPNFKGSSRSAVATFELRFIVISAFDPSQAFPLFGTRTDNVSCDFSSFEHCALLPQQWTHL